MEIISNLGNNRPKLEAVLFDFDGTISTLRHGWEGIMEPLMIEMIAGTMSIDEKLIKEVREYIDQSTGIQTYYQMKWLAEAVKRHGRNPGASENPWWYKDEYNRRFKEIAGTPLEKADCSKEAVLRKLIEVNKLKGPEVAVIGDGKVEIALGREVGAITLGVASDEEKLCGVNPVKHARLVKAGAHAIVGDFIGLNDIMNWLGI